MVHQRGGGCQPFLSAGASPADDPRRGLTAFLHHKDEESGWAHQAAASRSATRHGRPCGNWFTKDMETAADRIIMD